MHAQPSDSPSPDHSNPQTEHSQSLNSDVSSDSLLAAAKEIAADLSSKECCGVTQAEVFAHINESDYLETRELHPRNLARRIPTYAQDFEAVVEANATATNPVSRFFEKRRLFKEFVAHREEFLKDAISAIDQNHLIKRNIHVAVVSGHFGVAPAAATVEFFHLTKLGKAVLDEINTSKTEEA